ncbi:MAG: hypothetical protein FWF20_07785 [Betaproteobacteria bacterium]|nr:hypothetical protein [Betaproteobacteria bacterium]MCL2886664.1 hypothetical protein [Betaproteobacteria bacterium]
MMKPRIALNFLAALFALAAQAEPGAPQPAPSAIEAPRLAYGWLMRHAGKLIFSPCRDRSYAQVEDVSADSRVTRGLEMAGLSDERKFYVELLGTSDGATLRASDLNLARADGRCQKPGGSDEAWLAGGPGWALAAGGERVTLQRQGQPEVSLPYRVFTRQGEVAQFSGEAASVRLEARFEHKLCRDADTVLGWTATLRVGEQTLQGCAWQR